MYYHFAMLLLFRPMIKYEIIGSEVIPRDVCSQAADAIQALLASYERLYSLKRTPAFVPYFILTSTTVQLTLGAAAIQGPMLDTTGEMHRNVVLAVNKAVTDLQEMASSHRFAAQALSIVRFLANKTNITLHGKDREGLQKVEHSVAANLSLLLPAVVTNDSLLDFGKDEQGSGDSTQTPLPGLLSQRQLLLANSKSLEESGFQKSR